jgi:hypothetical protein
MPDSFSISALHLAAHRNIDAVAAFQGKALLMLIRDMGNGVDRLESSTVVPMADAKFMGGLAGWVPLALDREPRLRDMVIAAFTLMGLAGALLGNYIAEGAARAVGDHQVEIVTWLSMV